MSRQRRTAPHGHWGPVVLGALLGASLLTSALAQPGSAQRAPAVASDWMTAVPLGVSSAAIRPPDGAEVEQTPPDFSWPALAPGAQYRLTLTYPDGNVRSETTTHNWLNWIETLPPGNFVWRVEATTAEGTRGSASRRFRVLPEAVPFLVPRAEVLVQRAGARPHPRALPDAPRLAAMLASRSEGVGRLLRQVDIAAVSSFVAEPLGGTVAEIEEQAFAAVEQTVGALLAYVVTGEDRHFRQALQGALALAAWSPHGPTSYAMADQAARGVAATLALAYDWLWPKLDAGQRRALLAALEIRLGDMHGDLIGAGARIAAHPYDSHRNQTLLYLATLSTLLVGDLPAAEIWLRDTLPLALNWLSPWGGEDGGFANGTAYAQWVTGDSLVAWNILRWTVDVDVAQKAWVRNYARFLAYFLPPGTPMGVFGDGAELRLEEQWARFGKAYALFAPSPLARWYASQLRGEDAARPQLLLAPPADPAPAEYPADTPNAALFPTIGWVAMHSDLADSARTSIYFKSSPYGSFNHSHADQNSFVIVADGQPLAIDSGYYDGYGTEHWREWYKQTRAHNAVTFDGGRGQIVFEDTGEIGPGRTTHFADTPAYVIVSGDAAAAYGAAVGLAERTLVYLRPDTIVIRDRVGSASARRWEWNVHAVQRMSILSDNAVAIRNGPATLCITMLGDTPTTFAQQDVFAGARAAAGRPRQWHGAFIAAEPSTAAEFVAVLRVGCGDTEVVVRASPEREVEVAGHRVTFATDGVSVRPLG